MSKPMYQTTRCHILEDPVYLLYVIFVKTTGDTFCNSKGNTGSISFLLLYYISVILTKIYKTTCKYGSHTSNDEELLSSCSDLDTFDDLLADVLNQNKESFSPKRKQRRYRSYDCFISGLYFNQSSV
jgi:hypothetical protein